MTEDPRPKRRNIRYAPERLDYALIMYRADSTPFAPEDVGLILDEALRGAQIVLKKHPKIALGLRATVKLGRLAPLLATMVWVKEVDAELCRVGLEYVDENR